MFEKKYERLSCHIKIEKYQPDFSFEIKWLSSR